MRPGYEQTRPLEGFGHPAPFTDEVARIVPEGAGVHVVWAPDGTLLYVGETGHLRRRILQHRAGPRGSSILHHKIAGLLEHNYGEPAPAERVRRFLDSCEIAWIETGETGSLKRRIMLELQPTLNEKLPS